MSAFQPCILSPGRHLATHTALSFSTFQGSTGCLTVFTCKVYGHTQHTCSSSSVIAMASCPKQQFKRHSCTLLPSWPMPKAFQHMGLSLDSYTGCECCTSTWASQTHSKAHSGYINASGPYIFSLTQQSHKLAFMYDLLVLAQPLHQFPVQKVLWATLTHGSLQPPSDRQIHGGSGRL